MSDRLPMSEQTTSAAIPSAISSQASLFGVTPSGSLAGPTTASAGPEAAPVQVSRAQAKGKGLMTLVTSGRHGSVSSASVALESCLVSRLQQRLDTAGSTLFVETWKRKDTPLRRRYWEHTAQVRPTSDNGCTSLRTPTAEDGQRGVAQREHTRQRYSFDSQVRTAANLMPVPTPNCPTGGPNVKSTATHTGGMDLDGVATLASMATPRANDAEKRGQVADDPRNGLVSQANLASLTTPSARNWKDSSGMSEIGVDPDGSTRSRLDQLPRQAQLADSGATATGGTAGTGSGGQLEPGYSRWLQSLPRVFCDCAVMATQSVRKRPKPSSKRT